ncbi:alpha/beta fold hydrolase [Mucilaginibacter sp. X4EP1]|uniref:alpha/beta fold hydrolase n=1 Tax=Mucilaginibacter sp. X4EP1 TaxID=2723092 RepID=UPI0021698638|nr:alpha/beta hydrolase [Mucilaginibacter sp. X4EP1]MCS3815454.1 pimeloyl-ACP methyl ester carboxylesterase [Mucilaginibacter sp. X4EP1]
MTTTQANAQTAGKYADVNGIKMYYEIHGTGTPLILLHGGGSTIYTSFGRILPELAKTHRVIAIELQAHGHTGDRDAPETFAQDADDVVELMRQLNIPSADVLGFSNGGHTTLQMAISHPEKVQKIIIASAFYKRAGVPDAFWQGFGKATLNNMPQLYRDEYLKINHDSARLINMFNKDVQRMENFKDWTDEQIKSIKASALIVIGDHDLPKPEHAVEMYRLIPNSRLAILPGAHGEYLGEALFAESNNASPESFVMIVNKFLQSN